MSLRDLLLSLREQNEAERRLQQERSHRRAAWIAAYDEIVAAFAAALDPLAREGLLTVQGVKQEVRHAAWGDYEATVLTIEAPGKRAELRPVNEIHPGYAAQALLVRHQEGKRPREVNLYLFASETAPKGWQVRVSDLRGIFTTDVVVRSDTVFADVDVEVIHAALEKVLAN